MCAHALYSSVDNNRATCKQINYLFSNQFRFNGLENFDIWEVMANMFDKSIVAKALIWR